MTVLSVLTLVDSGEHLAQTYQSLVEQTEREWEWLVGPVPAHGLPAGCAQDPRVKVLDPPRFVAAQGPVGWRIFAFEQASASHVLDLPEHDYLHPDALAAMSREVERTDADVLYADFVCADPQPPPGSYDSLFGWDTYQIGSGPSGLRVVRAFDPEPSALHQPAYAPSHGLTWKRAVYLSLDGPDPNLAEAGDFDLVCRAYVAGYGFSRVDRCVVFSRRHLFPGPADEVLSAVSASHVPAVVGEWCRRGGLAMLDVSPAGPAMPGFVGVDGRARLPYEDGTAGCVRAFDFLSRLRPCPGEGCGHGVDGGSACVVGVMNEVYRVLAPGGWFMSETASSDGRGGFQNPAYCSFWNPNSFWYYTNRDHAETVPGLGCRFQAARVWQHYPTQWHEEQQVLMVGADLVALKGQRQPGISEI